LNFYEAVEIRSAREAYSRTGTQGNVGAAIHSLSSGCQRAFAGSLASPLASADLAQPIGGHGRPRAARLPGSAPREHLPAPKCPQRLSCSLAPGPTSRIRIGLQLMRQGSDQASARLSSIDAFHLRKTRWFCLRSRPVHTHCARFVRSEEGLELGRGPDLLPPSVKHMNR
jgi:hypothetical protein